MSFLLSLRCTICSAEYGPDEVEYVCPHHGNDGILDAVYDYDRIRREVSPHALTASPERSIWRYMPLLPVDPEVARRLAEGTVLGSVGWTPLYPAPRLARELGLKYLWVKDDSRQPTASFKDRASAIAVVKAAERGAEVVTTASTGNAAAALAGLCAAVGQRNVIFVPRTAPRPKWPNSWPSGHRPAGGRHYDQAFDYAWKRRRLRLVQPQHRLQPVYVRGQEDRRLRNL
jgi:L-threonine synthase (EC 4.2.3.1)